MAFLRHTWLLTRKNLLIACGRDWKWTLVRAVIAPILIVALIAHLKDFLVRSYQLGIAPPRPIRSLENALRASRAEYSKIVFVTNGYHDGQIQAVIEHLKPSITAAGKTVSVIDRDADLRTECPSSIRGATPCYGAISFHSSPHEGTAGVWRYTIRVDGALTPSIFVNADNNRHQIHTMPLQKAVDSAIAFTHGVTLPDVVSESAFTPLTQADLAELINENWLKKVGNRLPGSFLGGLFVIVFHLSGFVTRERQYGITQLIDAMAPSERSRSMQVMRMLSAHLAFSMIYFPSWIAVAIIIFKSVLSHSSVWITIFHHILTGFAMSSLAVAGGSLFQQEDVSGIVVTIVTIFPAIWLQLGASFPSLTPAGLVWLLLLVSPTANYTFFIQEMVSFQLHQKPANILRAAENLGWKIPILYLWIFLIIQMISFPVIGVLLESLIYNRGRKTRRIKQNVHEDSIAIQVNGFSKAYASSRLQNYSLKALCKQQKQHFKAADDINLKIRHGQLMCLLGANGSGKSTLLDTIAGLNSIEEGSIVVDGAFPLGYCPQKNVLWDNLTVFEHVAFFSALKTNHGRAGREEIVNLIKACDLESKTDARAKELSGGQKRKLQLAVMFAGDSKVCCIDEASSGLDPISRRKIWKILLDERGKRTILLTTHFLDEADILSDYVAMLSKGKLVAHGSAAELKHKYGDGYRVSAPNTVVDHLLPTSIAPLQKPSGEKIIFHAKTWSQAEQLLALLEKQGVHDYELNGPTINDVFLRFAEDVATTAATNKFVNEQESLNRISDSASEKTQPAQLTSNENCEQGSGTEPLNLSAGRKTSVHEQSWTVIKKRFIILRHGYCMYLFAIALLVLGSFLARRILHDISGISCDPTNNYLERPETVANLSGHSPQIPFGPSTAINMQTIGAIAELIGVKKEAFHLRETLQEFEDFIASNYSTIMPGGVFFGQGKQPTPRIAYITGHTTDDPAVITQSFLNSILIRGPIFARVKNFERMEPKGADKSVLVIAYLGMVMTLFPSFLTRYPTIERLKKIRALQYSNGIKTVPLWLAHIIFDSLFIISMATIVTCALVRTSSQFFAIGYLIPVFYLYGLVSALLGYLISLFTKHASTTFGITFLYLEMTFIASLLVCFKIFNLGSQIDIDRDINLSNFVFSAFSPSASLLRSLMLSMNTFSIACGGKSTPLHPMALTAYGGPMLCLLLQAIALFGLIIWIDSGYKPAFISRKNKPLSDHEARGSSSSEEPDIRNEANRTTSPENTDPLRVLHLQKSFHTSPAVDNLTFGIQRNEVFALLGPNGAGKSTTISLIRGDLSPDRPSGGDVLIQGHSITRHRTPARLSLGVCPQFDALDDMTVAEHLRFYAQARGVKPVEANVAAALDAVGLREHSAKLATKLSGGNRRKLTLAIALMGNPAVLLLDEPSSAMDPASKRVLWRVLKAVTPGRSLLITTHSMEEADALAGRVGIMAGRMLAVGETADLTRRFGDGLHVQIILKGAPRTSEREVERVKAWVEGVLGETVFEGRSLHGQMKFLVPFGTLEQMMKDRVGVGGSTVGYVGCGSKEMAMLFGLLEKEKEKLGITHYSVSPATLDQVFLKVVERHNVKEEQAQGRETDKGGRGSLMLWKEKWDGKLWGMKFMLWGM